MHLIFIICGYISTFMALVTQLPQIITVIKHRSAKNISYPYVGFILIDCIFYILYGTGFLLDNNMEGIPVILAGVTPFIITTILLGLKVFFRMIKHRDKTVVDTASVDMATNNVGL